MTYGKGNQEEKEKEDDEFCFREDDTPLTMPNKGTSVTRLMQLGQSI